MSNPGRDEAMPKRHPGESMSDYYKRMHRWLVDDTARSKGDDREWTGSQPFHLNRERDNGR